MTEQITDSKREAWQCKIGNVAGVEVPKGGDSPMREAVRRAFIEVTGEEPEAIFSGWGATFTPEQKAVIRNDGSWPAPKAEAMDYINEAQQTKSSSYHGNMVSKEQFVGVVITAIKSLQDLDVIKKALFYGRENINLRFVKPGAYDCNNLEMSALSNSPHAGIDLLHAIIGKATEAGELLEALFDAAVYGRTLDRTNVLEEVGDGFWYDAIILKVLSATFEEVQGVNIAKLRARFPDKFTEFDANNRDLSHERNVLDAGHGAKVAE